MPDDQAIDALLPKVRGIPKHAVAPLVPLLRLRSFQLIELSAGNFYDRSLAVRL